MAAFRRSPHHRANGTEEQYRLVREAVDRIEFPLFIIPGDHDRKTGSLDLSKTTFNPSRCNRSRYWFLFLNPMQAHEKEAFDLGAAQLQWLAQQMQEARAANERITLFMHTYPSELSTSAALVGDLIRSHGILLVEMGHTHYNELANDGHTISAATRPTGQIEEGPAGCSVTKLDGGVVSWKFKEIGAWPFVCITSPGDRRLIVDRGSAVQIVRGAVRSRARIWGGDTDQLVTARVCAGPSTNTHRGNQAGVWWCDVDSRMAAKGEHRIRVRVESGNKLAAEDSISVLVNQSGCYETPVYKKRDLDNAIGEYLEKGILGTQLGPNKNGRKW